MSTYTIVDLNNLFSRARHAVRGTADERAGIALSITFRTLKKLYREGGFDHLVVTVDRSPSWRHAVYPAYKRRRKMEAEARTKTEKEEAALFSETMDSLAEFLAAKTRTTVLVVPGCEGDDLVARWVQTHPNDRHIILSGDSDFVQLLAPNVTLIAADGLGTRTITTEAVVDEDGRRHAFSVDPSNGRVKVGEVTEGYVPEPDWWRKALFIKVIRGDSGDGVFSAYPGVRFEGSSKRLGIREAWEDRRDKGFFWNNFMLQEWEKLEDDGSTRRVRVLDEFRINESLIDLTCQPPEVKARMDEAIARAITKSPVSMVGMHFLRFCGKHDLPVLGKEAEQHAAYLNLGYPAETPVHAGAG
jgi:5'-3' exonuclease